MDQLLCNSMEVMECGKQSLHSFWLTTLILPVALMRRLHNLGIINIVIMTLTLVSIAIIIYYSITIYSNTAAENLQ